MQGGYDLHAAPPADVRRRGAGLMSVLIVAIFDEEQQTGRYIQSLRALHDQGRISLYAIGTIVRQANGVAPRTPVGRQEAAAGRAVGAAMGALLSLLEGPLHAASRAVPHSLIGALRELDDVGLDPAFLEQVSRDLPVGGAAVLSQLDELTPFVMDTLGPQHGGRVFRQRLAAVFAERRLAAEVTALRQEFARIKARNFADGPELGHDGRVAHKGDRVSFGCPARPCAGGIAAARSRGDVKSGAAAGGAA